MIPPPVHPTYREAFRFWLKLGFISFGGPTGQIAIMHTELVEKRRWIGEQRFLHALNYCMLLPGPEATQLATYCGWLLHGARGGLAAGILFVLPSAFLLWMLSVVYVTYGQLPWIAALFAGLKPAVVAIVAAALLRIARRALSSTAAWALAAGAFVALFWFDAPFPAVVGMAALIGAVGGQLYPAAFAKKASTAHGAGGGAIIGDAARVERSVAPTWARAGKILAVGLALWWAPVLVAALLQGADGTLVREGVFFSKAAMVTFGGAYAVLPYVGQQAVETHGWLSAAQMLDGLGLAETTPGPLIMVVQFVGFLGGWNHPDGLSPLLAATLGAAMTTWVTFVPCFLWIFLGAPHIEQLRGNARLDHALSAVTAAVVGVILNLGVWFGQHVFFPAGRGVDLFALAVAAVAFAALQWAKVGVITVVAASAVAGLVASWF